jgi:hypothetical protein
MRRTAIGVLLAALLLGVGPATVSLSNAAADAQPGLHVAGNKLVNDAGDDVDLLGVNRPGTEYACAQGWGIFDGPSDATSIASIASWDVDAVRVPLNEDCWLGINVPTAYSGATYRSAIQSYVASLNAEGLEVILDLHWSAPGTTPALQQEPMPDADHSPAFWSSVAAAFRGDANLAFELYNEPHGVSWNCWRNGCAMSGGWRSAGMQELLDVVRSAGANQPVLVDGLDYANDLSGFLSHPLDDPDHAVVAAFHVYSWSACSTARCWRQSVLPVADRYPVIATETGENDCSGSFVSQFFNWARVHGISTVVWAWTDNEGCESLITDYAGDPTAYGAIVKAAFARTAEEPHFPTPR